MKKCLNGTPSINFLRKIYNIITYKQERLDEIKKIEEKVRVEYNGDLKLAKSQCQNGNWVLISKEQLDDLDNKDQLEESLKEHMSIFKMYKQFHKKEEAQPTDADSGKKDAGLDESQLEQLARLIAISQNSTQLVVCIYTII